MQGSNTGWPLGEVDLWFEDEFYRMAQSNGQNEKYEIRNGHWVRVEESIIGKFDELHRVVFLF